MKALKSFFRIQSSPLNHNPTSQLNHNNTHAALEEKTWHKFNSVDGAITQSIT